MTIKELSVSAKRIAINHDQVAKSYGLNTAMETTAALIEAEVYARTAVLEHGIKMAERDYGEIIEEKNSKIASLEALALELAEVVRLFDVCCEDIPSEWLPVRASCWEAMEKVRQNPLLAELRTDDDPAADLMAWDDDRAEGGAE